MKPKLLCKAALLDLAYSLLSLLTVARAVYTCSTYVQYYFVGVARSYFFLAVSSGHVHVQYVLRRSYYDFRERLKLARSFRALSLGWR